MGVSWERGVVFSDRVRVVVVVFLVPSSLLAFAYALAREQLLLAFLFDCPWCMFRWGALFD